VNWVIGNALCLIAPLILLWGWVTYLRIPAGLDWRSRASLTGLSAPLLSVGLWVVMLSLIRLNHWDSPNPATQRILAWGVSIRLLDCSSGCRTATSNFGNRSRFSRRRIVLVWHNSAMRGNPEGSPLK